MKRKIIGITMVLYLVITLLLSYQNAWTGIFNQEQSLKPVAEVHVSEYGYWRWLKQYSQFGYFTTLTGILITICLALTYVFGVKIKTNVKLAVMVQVIVTALLFWVSIAPLIDWSHSSAWINFANANEHTSILIFGIIWLLMEKREKVEFDRKNILLSVSFPLIYIFFSACMFIGTNGQAKIYTFLNYTDPFELGLSAVGGSMFFILIFIFLLAGFILIYWILTKLNNKKCK